MKLSVVSLEGIMYEVLCDCCAADFATLGSDDTEVFYLVGGGHVQLC